MSVIGDAVFAALSGDTTVTGLVAKKIYPNKMPQGPRPIDYKAIVFSVVADVPQNALEGMAASRLRQGRVQIDCYAKTYDDVQAVADAVDAVATGTLNGWRDSSRDLYDDAAELHRVQMDVFVWR